MEFVAMDLAEFLWKNTVGLAAFLSGLLPEQSLATTSPGR